MNRRADRIIARAPKVPLFGVLITSGVGLTGALLSIAGYESTLALFGGLAVSTLVWMAFYRREGHSSSRRSSSSSGSSSW